MNKKPTATAKNTLKAGDIYSLYFELFGKKNPETGQRLITGILEKPISMKISFILRDVKKIAKDIFQEVESSRTELVKKYGKEVEPNSWKVIDFVPDKNKKLVMTKEFESFNKEFNEILEQDVEIPLIKGLTPEDFANLDANGEDYPVFENLLVFN